MKLFASVYVYMYCDALVFKMCCICFAQRYAQGTGTLCVWFVVGDKDIFKNIQLIMLTKF